jgi:hypothetical protein
MLKWPHLDERNYRRWTPCSKALNRAPKQVFIPAPGVVRLLLKGNLFV